MGEKVTGNEEQEFDAHEALSNRQVTLREFAEHGSELIDAMSERQQTLLISRRNKVVAAIVPITMTQIIQITLDKDPKLQRSLEQAARGETHPTTEMFPDES